MKALEPHRFADLFPRLPPEALKELQADIKAHGQREPVMVFAGKLLDGVCRATVCAKLGRALRTRTFRGSEADALAYVISANIRRRHLTESQRAMVAARLATLAPGRPGKTGAGAGLTQRGAAQALRVGERTVRSAQYVRKHGAPSEVQAVDRGDLTLKAVERALRARKGGETDGGSDRERDARQLTQYVRRLPDTARAFSEIARRVQRLSTALGMPLADCLHAATRQAVLEAQDAAAGLLRG